MNDIPKASMRRIMKQAGAYRVSEDGVKYLNEEIEDYAAKITHKAIENSQHAGRKTVMVKDIKLALKNK